MGGPHPSADGVLTNIVVLTAKAGYEDAVIAAMESNPEHIRFPELEESDGE
jgi:hypothetical protein